MHFLMHRVSNNHNNKIENRKVIVKHSHRQGAPLNSEIIVNYKGEITSQTLNRTVRLVTTAQVT